METSQDRNGIWRPKPSSSCRATDRSLSLTQADKGSPAISAASLKACFSEAWRRTSKSSPRPSPFCFDGRPRFFSMPLLYRQKTGTQMENCVDTPLFCTYNKSTENTARLLEQSGGTHSGGVSVRMRLWWSTAILRDPPQPGKGSPMSAIEAMKIRCQPTRKSGVSSSFCRRNPVSVHVFAKR